jgi:hypothetical protein
MKEAELRSKARAGSSKTANKKENVNGWDLEEEDEKDSDESDMEEDDMRPGTADYAGRFEMGDDDVDPLALSIHEMPTPAQRALEYISGRSTPRELSQRRPLSPPGPMPPMSPPRSKTTPPRVQRKERPKSLYLHSTSKPPEKADRDLYNFTASTSTAQKRRSSSSTKRLSFTDFTKCLSSTSSLLLVQTNASSSSGGAASSRNSRQSSEASFAEPDEVVLHRGLSQSRLSGMGGIGARGTQISEVDAKRCGWRGSGLGVFGGEGGFL